MTALILNILNGLLAVGSKFLSYLSDEKLREAGRNEVRLVALEAKVSAYAIVQEIDSRPTPSDKPGILGRL